MDGTLAIGAGLTAAIPAGEYAEILKAAFGAEASVSLRPAMRKPIEFTLRVLGETGIPADKNLFVALGNATLLGGGWRFALPRGFSLTPALEAGTYAHWLKASREDPMPNAWYVYFDPMLRLGVSGRYSRGNLEFEFAPTVSIMFERSGILPAAGVRAGVYRYFK